MVGLTVVGWQTTGGVVVCLSCASDKERLNAFHVGSLDLQIVKPSLNGHYVRTPLAEGYDAPCGICGWAVR